MQHWTLKRNDTNETIELHGQYVWADEYDWTPIAQSGIVRSITGAGFINQGTKKSGRPITLDCTHARIKRGDVELLQDWASIAKLSMILTRPSGSTYGVIFSRPALSDIKDIKPIRDEDKRDDDPMRANVHLMTF